MSKQELVKSTKQMFVEKFNNLPEVISIAPGRVNLIGEHVDYNDGLAMPSAIDMYVCVAISRNNCKKINAYTHIFDEFYEQNITNLAQDKLWHKYLIGSILEGLGTEKISLGMDIVIMSNLPLGKGLSSSAAFELSIIEGIVNLFNIKASDKEIISKCQKVDHDYIGVQSGTLDQSASKLSQKGSILLLDFRDNNFKLVDNDLSNCKWVLIDSMIKRELATSKYQERVSECKKALSAMKEKKPNLSSFRDLDSNDLKLLTNNPILFKRTKHIIEENLRVLEMQHALKENSPYDVGDLLIRSHQSLKELYEVSCHEIDFLIDVSKDCADWYGGRIMGGGFGGNTINLIKEGKELDYVKWISKLYNEKFGVFPDSYLVNFEGGVEIIDNISAV